MEKEKKVKVIKPVQKLQECSHPEKPSNLISWKNAAGVPTVGTKARPLPAGVTEVIQTAGANINRPLTNKRGC